VLVVAVNRGSVLTNLVPQIADFGLARAFGIPLRTYTHEVSSICSSPTPLNSTHPFLESLRSSLSGTDPPVSSSVVATTPPPSTSGRVVPSLLRWHLACLSSLVIPKSTKSSRSSGPFPLSPVPSLVLIDVNRLLGTPTTDVWPGLASMPDFKQTFPRWRPQHLGDALPEMDDKALHLLSGMLMYDPARRISGP
jgi:serine/threonine protein kinase